VYDFCTEVFRTHGVAEDTYQAAAKRLGERGVVELTCLVGYFITVSLVLNVAHTPATAGTAVAPLEPFPR
jgi:4-carboxymuconolactone decarboxylase